MVLQSVNPATEEVLETFEEFTPRQVDTALQQAHEAFRRWRTTSYSQRAAGLQAAARILRQQKARYAELITAEMGKPITEAEAEVEKCAWNCEFYADNGAKFLADEPVQTSAERSYVAYEPLGVVLAIMPWNFPFWQAIRFAAPALMAGNGALLKHAPNVPRCALAIEQVFREAGFPEGLFRTVLVGATATAAISQQLIDDERIRAVTLTGSDRAGSQVAAAAGRALKKTVLELGGSDPFVVLADANLPAAAELAARSRFQNTGQSCIAAKRFIVVEAVAEEFEQRFREAVARLPVDDPRKRDTRIGPLARADLRDNLERQVQASVAHGARVVLGGRRLPTRGYFFEPTILTGVDPQLPVFREETFGPAAAVIRAKDEEAALDLANDSVYGLGASIWTRDLERGQRLARQVESGAVFINGMVASDPRLPFGGVKRSGYGRELAAVGIREFTNIQAIWVALSEQPIADAPPTE